MSSFTERATEKFKEIGIDLNGVESGDIDEDFEDFDESSTEGEIITTDYQVGFPEEGINLLHEDADWRNWDGGKIGGRPCWLDPINLPNSETLQCRVCTLPMNFLLQIYCPLDNIPDAFHRSLYLFCCKKASCVAEGSVKCIRGQMGKLNDFYTDNPSSLESSDSHITLSKSKSNKNVPTLCELCGCLAIHRCIECKTASYCSKAHQKLDWKRHKDNCKAMGCSSEQSELKIADHTNHSSTGVDQQIRGALFKEYDLSVSQEELVPDSADAIESSTTIWEDAQTTGEKDEEDDLNLKQSDYDQALGNESRDPEYIKFLARVRRGGPDQILRYCRWDEKNGPLPISTIGKKNSFEPPLCEKCGSIRKFEFQVMPQLLYFLNVDGSTQVTDNDLNDVRRKVAMNAPPPEDLKTVFKNTNDEDIDWGTLDVYTCTASCELNNDGYCSEFVRCIEVPIKEKTK